jgi:predicted unusual protein kinase regulating ubiquinone biosynthesis (AarF/ABC1/UbiB family)
VTEDKGILCLIDFGLCVTVDAKERQAMTKALINLLYRDFDALVTYDTKELGFLPEDFDTEPLKPILVKVLTGGFLEAGSNMDNRKRKLTEISSELNEIFFQYPFQVPPFFALVTRGLGLLEGIALSGNPDFDIFKASMPFIASKRAISLIYSGATATATAKQEQKALTEPHHQRSLRRRAKDSFSWLASKWRADDNVASKK